MINTQMESFFSKLNEKYDIEIPEMREIWGGLSAPEIPDGSTGVVKPVGKAKKAAKPKDPNAPKRPRNAFMIFAADKRPEIREAEPELKFTDVGRRLGELWAVEKNSKSEEFIKYTRMAEEEKKNGRPGIVETEKPVKKAPVKKVEKSSEESEGPSSDSEVEKVPPVKKGGCKMAAAKAAGKGTKETEKGMEKCSTILQSGANKGTECGKPVKENGMCGRHAEMEKKKGADKKPEEKTEKESPAKPKKAPVKKVEEDILKGALKNDIEFLDEKLTELDEKKIEAIFIQNLDPAKKFNYYTITPISDETYMLQEDFGREIELEEGCENDKEEILKNLTNVDDFYVISKGCDAKKILKGLNGGK